MATATPRRMTPSASATKQVLQQELLETLQRYELIFSATNDVLYDLNLQTSKVVWNDALYSQFGYDKNEQSGSLEWWTGHIHPDDALSVENKFASLFEGNATHWQQEYRFRRADGGYNYVRDRGLILRGPNGTATRIIGSFLDITKQKQLDAAKDEFISLVSHQLRTPLSVIRFYSEMLIDGLVGELTTAQIEHMQNISTEAGRLIGVVGDILNISRLELKRVNISTVPADVNELLLSYIKSVLPLATEHGAKIIFNPDTSIPPIPLDDSILAQIVHNLLTNAIRYSNTDSGVITVAFAQDKSGYLLSVHDNGIGIPKGAQAHVFERFYRAKNAMTVEAQGTGLGLYIVKLITDSFGGKIWLTSRRREGTTFFLRIPESGMVAAS